MKNIKIIFILLLVVQISFAQEATFFSKNSTVFIGSKQPVSVYGNLLNEGNISIGNNGQLFFFGKIFYNGSDANLTDQSVVKNSFNGGTVTFQQPNYLYGDLGQQIIESKYNDSLAKGPSFSKLVVNNNGGVVITTDINIINNVNFQSGKFYLNNYVTSLGDDNNAATISGFNEQRYFVMDGNLSKSFLRLRSIGSCCQYFFPMGVNDTDYNPIQIRNLSSKADLIATVAKNPMPLINSLGKDSAIDIVWKISSTSNTPSQIELSLQHNLNNEGVTFNKLRSKSYITRFASGVWDMPNTQTNPNFFGNITSGTFLQNAMVNKRTTIISNHASYFSKKVSNIKKTVFIPNAFSPNNDGINDTWVIDYIKEVTNCRVEVFDRNGGVVFSSNGFYQPWNGAINGKPLPVGTYYYIIDMKNGESPLSGYVVILR